MHIRLSRPRKALAAFVVALTTVAAPAPANAGFAPPTTYDELINHGFLHSGHSEVLRLYQAVLDRTPEFEGAEFWVDQYDSFRMTTRDIAAFFVQSPEFEEVFGDNLDNEAFTTIIYRNVLDREPDDDGYAFWLGQLNAGMPRSEMVLLISNAPEFIGNNPLPSDARANTGPTFHALKWFLDQQEVCETYAAANGTTPPEAVRFEGADQSRGLGAGSGEDLITDGLGWAFITWNGGASDYRYIHSDEAVPEVFLTGCPPGLFTA